MQMIDRILFCGTKGVSAARWQTVISPAALQKTRCYPRSWGSWILALLVLFASPTATQAQFIYKLQDGAITLTGYTGPGGAVVIPDTIAGLPVRTIGGNAFNGCSTLTSVVIPDSVTSIEGARPITHSYGTFSDCCNLTTVTLGNHITNIGPWAFANCASLTSMSIPKSVRTIGDYTFRNCPSLTNFLVADGLVSIGGGALAYCSGLTSVVIPDSVTCIGTSQLGTTWDGAFQACTSLTSFFIPKNVCTIGFHAFAGCTNLTSIGVDPLNSSYRSVDGLLFDRNQTQLIRYPAGKAGDYLIPESVTNIASAFDGCDKLTAVVIPPRITYLGYHAFHDCSRLRKIFFEGNAPVAYGNGYVFDLDARIAALYLPGSAGWGTAFADVPTMVWLPAISSAELSFGLRTNRFGFNFFWARGKTVVVEACTDLANPNWIPLQTNLLRTGSIYFADPDWTNCPARLYRIRQ